MHRRTRTIDVCLSRKAFVVLGTNEVETKPTPLTVASCVTFKALAGCCLSKETRSMSTTDYKSSKFVLLKMDSEQFHECNLEDSGNQIQVTPLQFHRSCFHIWLIDGLLVTLLTFSVSNPEVTMTPVAVKVKLRPSTVFVSVADSFTHIALAMLSRSARVQFSDSFIAASFWKFMLTIVLHIRLEPSHTTHSSTLPLGQQNPTASNT